MKRSLIFLLGILLCAFTQAQHPFIDEFKAEQIAGGVFLQWTLKAGSICKGIQIEREKETSGEFVQIGAIEGVCGDVAEPVSYSFLDTSPQLGETNTYRLGLGGFGSTGIIQIFAHDFAQKEYALIQDISGQYISLLPRRPASGRTFIIYSIDGREQAMDFLQTLEETQVDISNLTLGIYVIQVLDGESSVFSSVFLKWQ
jgi:hypothetical protein